MLFSTLNGGIVLIWVPAVVVCVTSNFVADYFTVEFFVNRSRNGLEGFTAHIGAKLWK